NSLSPAAPQLLFHAPPGEAQPAPVEVRTAFIGTRHPDHYGGTIGHVSESRFALSQRLIGLLALGNVAHDDGVEFLAIRFELRDRGFYGELVTIGAAPIDRAESAHCASRNVGPSKVGNVVLIHVAEPRRGESVEVPAYCFHGWTAKDLVGCGVEHQYALTLINGDDSIHRRTNYAAQLSFAPAKRSVTLLNGNVAGMKFERAIRAHEYDQPHNGKSGSVESSNDASV